MHSPVAIIGDAVLAFRAANGSSSTINEAPDEKIDACLGANGIQIALPSLGNEEWLLKNIGQ